MAVSVLFEHALPDGSRVDDALCSRPVTIAWLPRPARRLPCCGARADPFDIRRQMGFRHPTPPPAHSVKVSAETGQLHENFVDIAIDADSQGETP